MSYVMGSGNRFNIALLSAASRIPCRVELVIPYHLPEHFVSQGISGPTGDWTHQAAGNQIPLLCHPRFMLWPSLFRNPLLLIMLPYPDPLSECVIPIHSIRNLCPKGAAAVLRVAWSLCPPPLFSAESPKSMETAVAQLSGSCSAQGIEWVSEASTPTLPADGFDIVVVSGQLATGRYLT